MKKAFLALTKSTLFILYVVGFVSAFSAALPAYVNSSFLGTITREQSIGFVYIFCAIFTLFAFAYTPRLLKKYGNYVTTISLLFVNMLALLGLAYFHNVFTIFVCFIATYVSATIIAFCFDIFLEHYSKNTNTGEVRSIYLTCINTAWLLSPWLSGLLIDQTNYWKVFLTAALVLIPTMFIILHTLKDFIDPEYTELHFLEATRDVFASPDIKGIFILNFLLQFFFAWMVIYTPIYLHEYIGFDWVTIGTIFTIMLAPFVLIQIPVGELADRKYGEKEMLTVSFLIMAISTALIPFIADKNFFIWALLLFVTRIGAAIAQVMCDVYLFKKVGDTHVGIIDLYRTMYPFANIFAPLIAIIFFVYFPFGNLFFLLGFLMLFGLRYSLALNDTK